MQNQKIAEAHRNQISAFAGKHTYRDLLIFVNSYQFTKIQERKKLAGSSLAYYKQKPGLLLLNFLIIDNEEVILLANNFNGNMSIKHPDIVQMFKNYYQQLWTNAIIIKDGQGVRQEVVDEISEDFK